MALSLQPPTQYRAVFVSDIHLGTSKCNANALLEFLQAVDCLYLYLVGDIIDLTALPRTGHWPPAHSAVIAEVIDKAVSGTEVYWVLGNHEQPLRECIDAINHHWQAASFYGVNITERAVHMTHKEELLLVYHGDRQEVNNPLLQLIKPLLYWAYGYYRRHITPRQRQQYYAQYKTQLLAYTKEQRYDGIITGHSHGPMLVQEDGLLFGNCGDWVGNNTAIVETITGELSLIKWPGKPL